MLTDHAIKAMQPPEKGYRILWDGSLKGFGCRISQAGTRAFVVLVASGRPKTIGRYPLVSLADARREARQLLAHKILGKVHPARTPFAEAVETFLADCRTRTRPRTLKDYTRLFKHFPFGRSALADIKPRDILTQLKPLPPSEKHHAFTTGRVFFRWCIHQHLIDRSPMENLDVPNNGRSRERILSHDELNTVWHATSPATAFNSIVRLLVLTGARRGEIAALQWSWINTEQRTITFPAIITKNKRTHTIPYGELSAHVFTTLPRLHDVPFLFPAARQRSENTTVFNGWGKPKTRLDRECGVTDWTLHDLRRTYATYMQQLGVRIEVTERLLNHVSGSQSGIVGVYQRYSWMPEMREAILKYEVFLATLNTPTA